MSAIAMGFDRGLQPHKAAAKWVAFAVAPFLLMESVPRSRLKHMGNWRAMVKRG